MSWTNISLIIIPLLIAVPSIVYLCLDNSDDATIPASTTTTTTTQTNDATVPTSTTTTTTTPTTQTNMVLLLGGWTWTSVMEVWAPLPQLSTPSFEDLPWELGWGTRAALLNNTIYVCGGLTSGFTWRTKSNSCYTATTTGQWHEFASMKQARVLHTLTAVGDSLMVTGGLNQTHHLSSSVEVYSPSQGWEYVNWNLSKPDAGHCLISINRSTAFMVSGDGYKDAMQVTLLDVTIGETLEHITSPESSTGRLHYCVKDGNQIIMADFKEWNGPWQFFRYDIPTETWNAEKIPNLPLDLWAVSGLAVLNGELILFGSEGVYILVRGTEWRRAENQPKSKLRDADGDWGGDVVVLPKK